MAIDRLYEATSGDMDRGNWVHLHEHLELQTRVLGERIEAMKGEMDRALSLARAVMDAKDQAIDKHIAAADLKIGALEATVSNFQGRLWTLGAGLGFFLTALQIGFRIWGSK